MRARHAQKTCYTNDYTSIGPEALQPVGTAAGLTGRRRARARARAARDVARGGRPGGAAARGRADAVRGLEGAGRSEERQYDSYHRFQSALIIG